MLIGVVGWVLASKIQASASFSSLARFSIGTFVGTVIGAAFLPLYCHILGILYDQLAYWTVSGACAGAVGGIIVIAFVAVPSEIDAATKPRGAVREYRVS